MVEWWKSGTVESWNRGDFIVLIIRQRLCGVIKFYEIFSMIAAASKGIMISW